MTGDAAARRRILTPVSGGDGELVGVLGSVDLGTEDCEIKVIDDE